MPAGPPAAATVTEIFAYVFLGLAAVFVPVSPILAGGVTVFGLALHAISTGIRDDYARHRRGSSNGNGVIPPIPPPPSAGIEYQEVCVDGEESPCARTIDLNVPAAWQVPFPFTGLGAGTHTIVINNISASSSQEINIDAVTVTP